MWTAGGLVSNIGIWMQRMALDWLVLTQLTHRSAFALGVVMALQFGPQLLFLPLIGWAADHLNQRRLLMVTQTVMGLLALVLGVLTVTGAVQLWEVYILAFLQGTVASLDAPVRQTFVAELVGDQDLPNAVGLNSASFNAARIAGPALGGLTISLIGTGWAFIMNGVSFGAVLLSLFLLRASELRPNARAHSRKGSFAEGLRYVAVRPDLKAILLMLFVIGTFGLNFPIFTSTMAVRVFHADARGFGLLSSILAVGALLGSLIAAGRDKAGFGSLLLGSGLFGLGCTLGALSPTYDVFAGALVVIGLAAMTFTTGASSMIQLTTEPSMRGRIMAFRLAISDGGTLVGAPLVGWVAEQFGPRWALGVGAASGFAAAAVAAAVTGLGRNRPEVAEEVR
jgi:MFS family permease